MRAFISALACCFLVLAGITELAAQEYRGSIRGAVRDTDGGVMPGVTITLTEEATGGTRTTVTNQSGEYAFASLSPATYTLHAELQGFAPYTRSGVILGVNRALVVDVTMNVGTIEETVTVTGETPLIETGTASVESALDKAQIEVLPTPGRNVFIMAVTTPNVVHTGDPVFVRQQDQTNSSLLSLGGGPLRGNSYTLDGVVITDMRNRAVIIPVFQAVEEMKVQVNTYDAEMGRTGGGVFNTIHRSGTNSWSGTALWQNRPKWGRTRPFFQKIADQPKSDAPYNLYGGAFGGPIARDRTFFWFSTEGYIATDLRNDSVTLPTTAMANGDFSHVGRTIYDPLTLDANGNRLPFPGNVIPADRLDPVGLALAQQLAGLGCAGDCAATAALDNVAGQFSFNLNHSFSDTWQMSGTYMYYGSTEPSNAYYADLIGKRGPDGEPVFGTGGAKLLRTVHVVAINSTHIPSDTSALTLRFGYTYFWDTNFDPPFSSSDASGLGWKGDFLNQITLEQFPSISVDGYGDGGDTHGSWSSNPTTWWSREASGTYSKFAGSHTFKFGAQWRRLGVDAFAPDGGFGFGFTQDFTQGPDPRNPNSGSGDPLASLLLGVPNSGTATVASPNVFSVDYFGGFIQDDWRVNDKLMLNLGLRIEHETGLKEENNNFTVGFYRDKEFPVQVSAPAGLGNAPGFPLRGGLMYAGIDGNPSEQWNLESIKLGPRAGFAYTINEDTVLRGGFGIFWAPYTIPGGVSSSNTGAVGYTAKTSYVSSFDGITPASPGSGATGSLTEPYPNGLLQPTKNTLGQLTQAGQTIYFNDQFKQAPYITKWSFDFQRELGAGVALKMGYVGSKGTHLGIGGTMNSVTNINQLDQQYLALGSALDDPLPNPFYGDSRFGGLSGSPTLPRGQLLRPFPQFLDVRARHRSTGRSRYDALRVEVEKRFRGSWGARVNYTYSRQKDNIYESNTLLQDEESTVFLTGKEDRDFGWSRVSSPHWLNLNGLYRFPSPDGGAAEALFGGWSASVTAIMRSGFPLTIKQNSNNLGSKYGFDHQRPNSTGADPSVSGSVEDTYNNYINASAFENAPAFTPGNTPQTITSIRTPQLIDWDISFEKMTRIAGSADLSLRFEFINIFDGVNWRGPRSSFGRSNFGQIQGVRGFPRMLQFMAKFTF